MTRPVSSQGAYQTARRAAKRPVPFEPRLAPPARVRCSPWGRRSRDALPSQQFEPMVALSARQGRPHLGERAPPGRLPAVDSGGRTRDSLDVRVVRIEKLSAGDYDDLIDLWREAELPY